jgi:DNA repair protein SbcC/Rad50
MVVEKITIKNFQSHEETELQFSSGVNVIVGSSDSGKSAILRALKWVVQNKPSGTAFFTEGSDECSVEIIVDGKNVKRFRNKKEKGYSIDGSELKAVSSGVPDIVNNLLNMSDVNMQDQMDSPFLLSDSAGEISRRFNRVANLEKIDSSLKKIDSMKRSRNSNVKDAEKRKEFTEEEVRKLSWLDEAETGILSVEFLERKIENLSSSYEELGELLLSIDEIESKIVPDVEDAFVDIESSDVEYGKIESLQKEVSEFSEIVSSAENVSDSLKLVGEIPDTVELDGMAEELYGLQEYVDVLYSNILSAGRCEIELNVVSVDIDAMENEFRDEMPEECPLCGRSD